MNTIKQHFNEASDVLAAFLGDDNNFIIFPLRLRALKLVLIHPREDV
jgi:hypothetical protein